MRRLVFGSPIIVDAARQVAMRCARSVPDWWKEPDGESLYLSIRSAVLWLLERMKIGRRN